MSPLTIVVIQQYVLARPKTRPSVKPVTTKPPTVRPIATFAHVLSPPEAAAVVDLYQMKLIV